MSDIRQLMPTQQELTHCIGAMARKEFIRDKARCIASKDEAILFAVQLAHEVIRHEPIIGSLTSPIEAATYFLQCIPRHPLPNWQTIAEEVAKIFIDITAK